MIQDEKYDLLKGLKSLKLFPFPNFNQKERERLRLSGRKQDRRGS